MPDFADVFAQPGQPAGPAILNFLNSGGTRQAVIMAFRRGSGHEDNRDGFFFFERDLTGDSVPELVIDWDRLYVFGCSQGKYVVHLALTAWPGVASPDIEAVRDMNLDGVPEIVTSFYPCLWGRCGMYSIYEWDGGVFQELIYSREYADNHVVDQADPTGMSVEDVDGNGTLELLGGVPYAYLESDYFVFETDYYTGLPWREETNIYMWNGEAFVFFRTKYASPEYRFQAVQDGDRAALVGEYDEALDFYQQAIFSDKLDWWSDQCNCYMQPYCRAYADMFLLTPTPIPTPTPDSSEYYNLAAYARFRIMLIYVLRGWLPEAQTVFDTLQARFPEGQVGHAYAQMAVRFWEEYIASQNVGQACDKAVEFAAEYPRDILAYLGNREYSIAGYGNQSLSYMPEDVCSFR